MNDDKLSLSEFEHFWMKLYDEIKEQHDQVEVKLRLESTSEVK